MSTLRTERNLFRKRMLCYLCISAFTALFGFIYEQFSHEVYSVYMMFAFLIPLCGSIVLFLLPFFLHWKHCWSSVQCFHSSIATFTTGSLLQGTLEIYGTTNHLITYYWITGAALLICGILLDLMVSLHSSINR